MRAGRADDVCAVALALLLHAVLIGALFVGMLWTRAHTPPSAGEPVTADLYDPDSLSAATRRALAQRPEPVAEPPPPAPEPTPDPEPLPEPMEDVAAPLPQPIPEPRPQDAEVAPQQRAQDVVPEPAEVDQDAARRDVVAERAAEREQEEKRRQAQIDLTERERQREVEQAQRLAREQKAERDRKLAEIRAQREKLARESRLAEEKLRQIADRRARGASEQAAQADAAASAPPPPGNGGVDPGLAGAYQAALQAAILRNWTRPDNVPQGQRCRITIRQLPGGEVSSVEVSPSCPYDELGRRSVEAAVLRAQPLPYAGFESVFNRTLNLNFEAQDR